MPKFNLIERALGEQIHDAVFGNKSPRQALRDAENQILASIRTETDRGPATAS